MTLAWTLLPLLAANPAPERVTGWLHQTFGDSAEAVTGFEPSSLAGDFNGDGVEDLAIVVTLPKGLGGLPKTVKVLWPYGFDDPKEAESAPTPAQRLIAIIHGGRSGKETVPQSAYLFAGGSNALIVQTGRTADELKDVMSVVKKKRKPKEDVPLTPPKGVRGDSLYLDTEAAGALLYWNGKTYRWYESPED